MENEGLLRENQPPFGTVVERNRYLHPILVVETGNVVVVGGDEVSHFAESTEIGIGIVVA